MSTSSIADTTATTVNQNHSRNSKADALGLSAFGFSLRRLNEQLSNVLTDDPMVTLNSCPQSLLTSLQGGAEGQT